MPSPIMPTAVDPVSYEFRSIQKTLVSDAVSGKRLTRQIGGQRWELTLKFPPMTRAQFGAMSAFFNKQGGKHGEFYVLIPALTGTAGADQIGNMVNFDNDTKLHQITAFTDNVDPTPDVTDVYPSARVGGGNLVTSPVYLKCSLARDVQVTKFGDDNMVRVEVDLIERL